MPESPNISMPNQHDTQLRQWAMLQSIPRYPRKITARDITERMQSEGFEVSKRTVERDLLALSEIFPITSDERTKPFGWSWEKDAAAIALPAMSPIQALTLELAHLHLEPLFPACLLESMTPYFLRAEKILDSGSGLEKLANWRKKVEVVPPTQPLLPPNYPLGALEVVHEALLNERQLDLSYHSRQSGITQKYRAHPLGLVQRGPIIYFVVTLFDYPDVRSLAMHRIESAQILDEPSHRPVNFDLRQHISQGAFGFEEKGAVRLIARFNEEVVVHLRETPLSEDQVIENDRTGWLLVKATVLNTSQLRWWLLGFGGHVEVIEPAEIREEICEAVQAMAELYGVPAIRE